MAEAVPLKKAKAVSSSSTEARISVLESQVTSITADVSKLDDKVEQQYQTLHSRISDLRDDLRQDFEAKQDKIVKLLDDHSSASTGSMAKIMEKIQELEKWRWMLVGAAVVLGFFLAHIKLDSLF